MSLKINDFVGAVDDPFWKAITSESVYEDVIKFKDIDRNAFLVRLAKKINRHLHAFPPPEYLYLPKSKGILRRIKVYGLEDSSIYYYCVKGIQDTLAKTIKQNPFVFGGFRFTPDLKMSDEDLDAIPFDPKYQGVFSKHQFRKEWGEYQRLAGSLASRDFDLYIHIDIAHFYDDINLNLLENKVRGDVTEKN